MSNIINKINELKLQYPNATIKFNVSEDTCFHEFNSLYIDECDCSVRYEELTDYENKLLDLDGLQDEVGDEVLNEDHEDLSDAEYDLLFEDRCDRYIFTGYIIVRIGGWK